MALECGVPAEKFWDFTLQELIDIIDSYKRRQKEVINKIFVLADVISNRIGYLFTLDNKRDNYTLAEPWHYYPDLFEKDMVKNEDENPEQDAELQAYNLKMMLWADRWNQRRKEKPDDTRRTSGENQG